MSEKAAKTGGQRTTPLIWVKQVTLYKSISPVQEIRTIPLTPGINIIQGKSDDSTQDFESGHGNGKTTLCRLLRYCLGEKTFGQEHVVAEVKHCFPDGYVGAVIVVDDEEWAVLRTVGVHRKEYACQGLSLSDFAASEDRPPYSEFLKQIQDIALSGFPHKEVLSGGEAIQWLHILSLCSRDQESRYDRFWNVRPARSGTGFAKFTKIDVSLSVRSMLGLLNIREPQILKRQAELESELSKLRDQIKDKRAEPAIHITQLRTRLLNEYAVEQADTASLNQHELFNITQLRDARLSKLEAETSQIDQEIADLDTQINGATVRINEIHDLSQPIAIAKEITAVGSAVLEQSVSPESQRQTILERMYRLCPSGELVRECEKVQEKLRQLEGEIKNKKQSEQQKQTLKSVKKQNQVEAGLSEEVKQQESPLQQIRGRVRELNFDKNKLLMRRGVVSEWQRVIPLVTNELLKWHRIEQGEETYQDLKTLLFDEELKVDEYERLKTELTELLAKQNERIRQFQQRFHSIVQRVINGSFNGLVSVAKDELAFRISREGSLAGEAYETLSVLLADLAILMESSSEHVCHPGLLIHDSPREADLNIHLYQRMLEVAHSMMGAEEDASPFQYIVTTTTEPSKALQGPKITKQVLSSGAGSLFGIQLEVGEPTDFQKGLFWKKGSE